LIDFAIMLDFLKLVESFEHHGVPFVSVTQSVKTTQKRHGENDSPC